MWTNFVGKHKKREDEWPGSLAIDLGEPLSRPHDCPPAELISDRHYNVYVKFGLARAYANGNSTEQWIDIYEAMQYAVGHTPRTKRFLQLIDCVREEGFDPSYSIPIDINYNVLDGTHRLAACLALGRFPKVQKFGKLSRPFPLSRFSQSVPKGLGAIEQLRIELLQQQRLPSHADMFTVIWGVSLPLWDSILSFMGQHRIKRAFQRQCTLQQYAKIIALTYAADGISDKSLLRKVWTLSKFNCQIGVVVLDVPPEDVVPMKLALRDEFIPKVDVYHYDSLVHTIDTPAYAAEFLQMIQPCKAGEETAGPEEFTRKLDMFFYATKSKNALFRTQEHSPAGEPLSMEASAQMQIEDRFKLVIFDLDGVIVDSERISARAYQRILKKAGYNLSFTKAYELFAGISKADGEQKLRGEFGIELTEEEKLEKQRWVRLQRTRLKPIPGIKNIIAKISCPVCIASGSSLETIGRTLTTIGFEQHFPEEHRFSAAMVARGKPAPDLFLLCAEKMEVEPDECIVIEDSLPGVAAAKAAGMHFFWFSGAIHSEKYADQIAHYAGVRNHPDADALERSLKDYGAILRS